MDTIDESILQVKGSIATNNSLERAFMQSSWSTTRKEENDSCFIA